MTHMSNDFTPVSMLFSENRYQFILVLETLPSDFMYCNECAFGQKNMNKLLFYLSITICAESEYTGLLQI